jgi:hypothetical protein
MTDSTMLLRQIHPAFVQADQATSQAFRPTLKDDGKLSVYDGDKITAEKAWSHYSTLGNESAGVMGLLVEECTKANVSAAADSAPFPEHCVVDFAKLTTNKEVDNTAKVLKRAANARGWLHR